MSGVSDEIFGMLAKERGLPRGKIASDSRLLDDLGMDGDDAVEFFLSIQE